MSRHILDRDLNFVILPVHDLRFERSYVAIVRAHGRLSAAEQDVLDRPAAAAPPARTACGRPWTPSIATRARRTPATRPTTSSADSPRRPTASTSSAPSPTGMIRRRSGSLAQAEQLAAKLCSESTPAFCLRRGDGPLEPLEPSDVTREAFTAALDDALAAR